MIEHAQGDIVDPFLMTLDEMFERFAVTCAGAKHEILIFRLDG
jgi:hypothetical protein